MSEDLEKLRSLSFKATTIGRKASSEDVVGLVGRDTEIGEIARDKVIFKTITRGNASDKGLKRDVETIVRERAKRNDWRPKKLAEIQRRKEFHRKKWGKDSIQ